MDLTKLVRGTQIRPARGSGQRLSAIVHLNSGAIMPECVTIRSRIAGEIFTVDLLAEDIDRVRADKRVASVSVSRPLRVIGE